MHFSFLISFAGFHSGHHTWLEPWRHAAVKLLLQRSNENAASIAARRERHKNTSPPRKSQSSRGEAVATGASTPHPSSAAAATLTLRVLAFSRWCIFEGQLKTVDSCFFEKADWLWNPKTSCENFLLEFGRISQMETTGGLPLYFDTLVFCAWESQRGKETDRHKKHQ